MLNQDYQSLKNFPLRFKQLINPVNISDSDSAIIFNTAIISAENNWKYIYISATILNEFNYTYYNL